MKLLRLDSEVFPVSDYERQRLSELGFSEIVEINGNTPEEIIACGKDADIVVVISGYLPAKVIDKLDKCRLIMRRGTGCDKIDIDRATERGIMVANLPAFAIEDVADHAIMLMLAVARNLHKLLGGVDGRDWVNLKKSVKNTRVSGKTLGIVGFGNIGKEVAMRGRGFGMRIIDYHRTVRPDEEAALGVEPVSFDYLIRESDFIIITCPKTPETLSMFGEEQFKVMKKTAFLINVGRGDVTDEKAFAEAVRNKEIAGGATDVFQHLNMFAPAKGQVESYYSGIENFITTPHCAADTAESKKESIDKYIEQMSLVMGGYFPTSWKNPQVAEKLAGQYRKYEDK